MSSIKLKHASGNGVSITAPSSNPAADRTLELPSDADGIIAKTDSSGNLAVTGDLTVDTSTLKVDSSNNRVGVGTTSPSHVADFVGANETTFDHVGTIHLSGTDAYNSGNAGAGITFSGKYNSSGSVTTLAQISGIKADTGDGTFDGALTFGVRNDAAGVNIERMRILNSGGITFNGDTAEANALNDYEEGLWTPTVIAGNPLPSISDMKRASYVKIGRLVTVSAYFVMASTSSNTDNLTIGGLPFTARGGNRYSYGVARVGTMNPAPIFQINAGTTNLSIMAHSGSHAVWNNAINTYIIFSATYERS